MYANKKSSYETNLHNCLMLLQAHPDLSGDPYDLWAHLGLNQGPPDYESGALTS